MIWKLASVLYPAPSPGCRGPLCACGPSSFFRTAARSYSRAASFPSSADRSGELPQAAPLQTTFRHKTFHLCSRVAKCHSERVSAHHPASTADVVLFFPFSFSLVLRGCNPITSSKCKAYNVMIWCVCVSRNDHQDLLLATLLNTTCWLQTPCCAHHSQSGFILYLEVCALFLQSCTSFPW